MDYKTILNKLATTIADGDEEQSRERASEALANGLDPLEAVEQGLFKGMDIIGDEIGADGYGQSAIQAVEVA
jgi:methanogenic corrinoid protein MtbC1